MCVNVFVYYNTSHFEVRELYKIGVDTFLVLQNKYKTLLRPTTQKSAISLI